MSCDALYKPEGEVRNMQSTPLTSEMKVMESNEHTRLSTSPDAFVSSQSDRPLICPFMAVLFLIPLLFTLRAKSFTVFHFCLRKHFYSFGTKCFLSPYFNVSCQWPCCRQKPWCCWWITWETCHKWNKTLFLFLRNKDLRVTCFFFLSYICSILNHKNVKLPLIVLKRKGARSSRIRVFISSRLLLVAIVNISSFG